MILIPKLNLVILTPGKTASSSLRLEMSKRKYGAILLHGPQGEGADYNRHTPHIPESLPEGMKDPKVAVIVRNPYDRAVSLWKHYRRYTDREISFAEFVDSILTAADSWWFFRFTISQTLEGTRFDHVLKFESLLDDLNRMGVKIKRLPSKNLAHDGTPYVAFYDADTQAKVRSWAADDFRLFGYEPDPL